MYRDRVEALRSREGTGITVAALCFAVLLAWYVGFRSPNTWTTTLDAVSITDGFHRRFVVGTLLRPLANAADYNYWLFATFSFAVLACHLAILVTCALRATLVSRRMLVIAFLALPTGGFLFHTVGYFEQVLYLLLFASIWLLHRKRLVAATIVMAIAPMVHEIAILSVIPIFGVAALRTTTWRRAVIITAIPAVVDVVVLLLPAASESAVPALTAALQQSNFAYRPDALELFTRTQTESWQLYRVHEVVVRVKPVAYFAVITFGILWWTNRAAWNAGTRLATLAMFVACAAAIGIPGLLVYAGWDHNRWIFMILANFFIIVWLLLDEARRDLNTRSIVALVVIVLVMAQLKLDYFDSQEPRGLSYREVRTYLRQLRDGRITEIPAL